IYKWEHSRKAIAEVLARKYVRLEEAGRQITDADIHRDVKHFFHDVFWNFLKKPLPATADENGGMNR
ncbi:hypothetical protein, partial [Francisella tularensis]|uniref:hypothetical protein n=1 Tax=Francisella tularensis TaxID=263 RepID=UPI001F448C92